MTRSEALWVLAEAHEVRALELVKAFVLARALLAAALARHKRAEAALHLALEDDQPTRLDLYRAAVRYEETADQLHHSADLALAAQAALADHRHSWSDATLMKEAA
jgi:hypothetical protein